MLIACNNDNSHNFPLHDMSEYDIEGGHRFYYVTMYEALQLRDDDSFNGILYFGFPGCDWCQAAVPVIHEASQQTETDIFYVSRRSDLREGEWLEWDVQMAWWLDGQIEMRWLYYDEEGNETTQPTDEPARPNIFVPQIIHLRNGAVVDSHRGTFEGHERLEDNTLPALTDAEDATLLATYMRIFAAVSEPEACGVGDEVEDCS